MCMWIDDGIKINIILINKLQGIFVLVEEWL